MTQSDEAGAETPAGRRGRKLEFDPGLALRRMTRVFWEIGYDETTYTDLVAATGVQRYGLYRAFGDKPAAFEKALACYVDEIDAFTAPMRAEGAGLAEIEDYFRRLFDVNRETPVGCMVCNTAPTPIAAQDPIARSIDRMFTIVRESITDAARHGIATGNIDRRYTPEQVGTLLLGTMIAMTILVQLPFGWEAANEQVRSALDSIRSAR